MSEIDVVNAEIRVLRDDVSEIKGASRTKFKRIPACTDLTEMDVCRYFDGASHGWRIAGHQCRGVVLKLMEEFCVANDRNLHSFGQSAETLRLRQRS